MGSSESSEGRRVSFGMDEEERVRVLQGIRLSENVVNRMKDPSQPSKVGQPVPPCTPPSSFGTSKGPQKDTKQPKSEHSGDQQPFGPEDLLRRYKQEQATFQEELFQVAKREREAARKHWSESPQTREGCADQEKLKAAQMARELENWEAELKRRETIFKEQLGCIEKKNAEMYKLSSQQFHEMATKIEGTLKMIRSWPEETRRKSIAEGSTCAKALEQEITSYIQRSKRKPVCLKSNKQSERHQRQDEESRSQRKPDHAGNCNHIEIFLVP
ncbi:MICOS complex subunit MIC25 isoform X2 [Talpa occidentalis]|uniref:MICOS complex subunit MIC25 isoform X2 n=1 Tax=Talpa occidentalis TaxID=50954 RepID=UPI0023F9D2A2|nr:MICOS complex subunit MIC25 isoform X2 [Talpa occidentalis]